MFGNNSSCLYNTVWWYLYQDIWAEVPWCPTTEPIVPAICVASKPCALESSSQALCLRCWMCPCRSHMGSPYLNKDIKKLAYLLNSSRHVRMITMTTQITVPEVGWIELLPRTMGQGEQVPQSLQQHVHSCERALVQDHPQALTATEACGHKPDKNTERSLAFTLNVKHLNTTDVGTCSYIELITPFWQTLMSFAPSSWKSVGFSPCHLHLSIIHTKFICGCFASSKENYSFI